MKIEFELNDVGCVNFFETYMTCLSSISPEDRAQKMKELGKEPLCKENFVEHLFTRGLVGFMKDLEQDSVATTATGILKAETVKVITDVTSKIVNLYVVHDAKLKAVEKKFGKDSKEYRDQQCFVSGVIRTIAEIDADLTGSQGLQKALKVLEGEDEADKPRRKK